MTNPKERLSVNNKLAMKIYRHLKPRVVEVCEKFRDGNYNGATLVAFDYGAIGDIEDVLDKAKSQTLTEVEKIIDEDISERIADKDIHPAEKFVLRNLKFTLKHKLRGLKA